MSKGTQALFYILAFVQPGEPDTTPVAASVPGGDVITVSLSPLAGLQDPYGGAWADL